MKIYIISAAIVFCSNTFAMDNSKNDKDSLTHSNLTLIAKSSGCNIDLLISECNKVRTRNKKCTLKKLLSPCRYLNPFRSKL